MFFCECVRCESVWKVEKIIENPSRLNRKNNAWSWLEWYLAEKLVKVNNKYVEQKCTITNSGWY